MKKVAILIEDHYEDTEAYYPYIRLKEEGWQTRFVGPGRAKEYKSKYGYPAVEEMSVRDARTTDFSGVIIPGGYAPDWLRRSDEIVKFVRDMDREGKLVAAICHAGWVLASAGILKGRKVTGFSAIKDDLVNAGAEFQDKEVVVDRNLITSRNPYDLPAFCSRIIGFLKERG